MKTFVRLIRRYVLAAVGIVLLLVFLGIGLLVFLGWQETSHLPQRTYASSEIADAMVNLARHPVRRKQMGENGYRRVMAKYKISDMQQTYRKIYETFENIDW